MKTFTEKLSAQWRDDAEVLRRCGAVSHADLLVNCAAQIEAEARAHAVEELTIDQAVAESGFTYSSIQQKLANGELENVGDKGRPRVRRGDLPKKGGSPKQGLADGILSRRLARR